MMDDGTYGRYGMSTSGLDGVPFKIGSKFRPPPKVIYQPVIENLSRNLDEYTFETEEAVLAWAKAREEALKKASTEQAEKAKKKSSSVNRNGKMEQLDKGVDGENNVNMANGNNSAPLSTAKNNGLDNADETVIAKPPPVTSKPLIPKKLPSPGAILKPTPIQHSNKSSSQNGNDGVTKPSTNPFVDVSMFESAADPFDTLELQTLDDMEELKALLDSASASSDPKSDQRKSSESNPNVDSSEGFYDLAAPVTMESWEKFEDDSIPNTTKLPNNFNNKLQESVTGSSESPVSDDLGEYVDIDEACLNSKAVNGATPVDLTKSDSSNAHSSAASGNGMSKVNLNKGIYKPILPPIPHNKVKVLNGESDVQSSEQSTTATVSMGTTSVSFSSVPCLPSSVPKPTRPAPLPPAILNHHLPTGSPNDSQTSLPKQSLTNSMEGDINSGDELIVNPYSRHSANTGHSDSFASTQSNDTSAKNGPSQPPLNQLNRYSPLPPFPAPKPKEVGLTDPYHNLSHEFQGFVDTVTSMGFRRAKVSRAVEKFGQDEKEVLDHLFAVDLLVEKKYAPIHVEAALQSCKNDLNKAEELLKLQVQLEQLGFSSDSVRDALVASSMDYDKALDILTK